MYLEICSIFFVFLLANGFEIDEQKVTNIDVKPGGMEQESTVEWGGVACKFIYACQGGTNEQWEFTIARTGDHSEYVCSVARPSGTSYLFFQQFRMEVNGFTLEDADAFSQSESTLSPEEYSIDREKNTVTHVEGSFKSQLAKLDVFGVTSRDEL